MKRKSLSLRTTVIVVLATGPSVAAGVLVEAVAAKHGVGTPGLGHLASVVAGLWVAERLDGLIEDPRG